MTYTFPLDHSQSTALVRSPNFPTVQVLHPNSPQIFRRRTHIPLKPNQIWQIEQGFVRTSSWNQFGDIHTIGIWGAGDIVGLPLSQADPYQVECLTTVCASSSTFTEQNWQPFILSYLQNVEALLGIVHIRSTAARLLQLLYWLAERFGIRTPQGWLLEINLTHQSLAELIGSTRVTVTRQLQEFEQDGQLVKLRRHSYLLPNR
jgi:CRP-like cAMP-binding protein